MATETPDRASAAGRLRGAARVEREAPPFPRVHLVQWLWRLRVVVKTALARHRLLIEFCHDCGREQPLVWYAEDSLWSRVMGRTNGVCCPECFDRRASADGVLLTWRPYVARPKNVDL